MISYVNVHAVLEGRRNRAKASPTDSESSQVLHYLCPVTVMEICTIYLSFNR